MMETEKNEEMNDPRLLEALAHLNQIGSAINRLDTADFASVHDVLRMVVDSAAGVVPGASAVIYTYDARNEAFDTRSRVSAGESEPEL